MGLLQQALAILPTLELKNEDLEDQTKKLLTAFKDRPQGIDLPGAVFTAFHHLYKIEKGVLLLPEYEKGNFVSWASEGLDRTTTRKLRLPPGHSFLSIKKPRFIQGSGGDSLLPFFSNREGGLVNYVFLVPFWDEEKLEGLLLVSQSPLLPQKNKEMLSAGALLGNIVGAKLRQSRGAPLSRSKDAFSLKDDPTLAAWLSSYEEKPAIVSLIDLTGLMDSMKSVYPEVERFRLREDAISTLTALTGRLGHLRDMGNDKALLLFLRERFPHKELYLSQMKKALRTSFQELPSEPHLHADFWDWPEERKTVEEKLLGYS